MTKYLKIDGSFGEGGGQILRSSLSLSLLTGTPIQIVNIRSGRARPGLMRQHLTSVRAAAAIGHADIAGDKLESQTLEFVPGPVHGGNYDFKIETAGSVMLVLQTILPALILADAPSKITLSGGTHNHGAPPFEFFQNVLVPLISRMGPKIETKITKYGFYPAGGGAVLTEIEPVTKLTPLHLTERGMIRNRRGEILISNLSSSIADRELQAFYQHFAGENFPVSIRKIASPGPGNIIQTFVDYENICESFNAFGVKGKRAEKLVDEIIRDMENYQRFDVPVGVYTADQIMLPMALQALRGTEYSSFRTLPLSSHSKTHLELIRQFIDIPMEIKNEPGGSVYVRFGK